MTQMRRMWRRKPILKAFANLRQFRGESKFSTWLIQITVNEARMRQRKQHAQLFEPLVESNDEKKEPTLRGTSPIGGNSFGSAGKKRNPDLAGQSIGQPGTEISRSIYLARRRAHEHEEAAEALNISIASVKTRLLRARLMLRDILAPDLAMAGSAARRSGKGASHGSQLRTGLAGNLELPRR